MLIFRKLTKPYEKELRYTMKTVDGGKKADLNEIFTNSIPKILDKQKKERNREVPADHTLNVMCTIGMDGGGSYSIYNGKKNVGCKRTKIFGMYTCLPAVYLHLRAVLPTRIPRVNSS